MKYIVSLMAIIAVTGCSQLAAIVDESPRFEPDERGVIVIANDNGGNVENYLTERDRLKRLGLPIEIRGKCVSACTVFYSLPTACLASGSYLGFHGVSGGGPLGPTVQERQLRDTYRNGIRDQYWSEWRMSNEITKVPAAEVIRLDPEARIC
jgi:hypothetical protein